MKHGLFVSATDTSAGKTHVAQALLRALGRTRRVVGYKPVAAGAELVAGAWRNEDALLLQAASTPVPAYERVNPICLPMPVSPHLAACQAGVRINVDRLVQGAHVLFDDYEMVVAEGAGGWRVPLNEDEDISTLALRLGWPVVLVVGLRLGCINHARLTLEAMRADGVALAGWIANAVDPQLELARQVRATLLHRLDIPLLADMPHEGRDLAWTEAGLVWGKESYQIVFDSPK